MTMTEEPMKPKPPQEIKKLESVVKKPQDIAWDTDDKNKYIASSVLDDDLSLVIIHEEMSYMVRSPDFRIIDEYAVYHNKMEKHAKDPEKNPDLTDLEEELLGAVQKRIVQDMIPMLDLDDLNIRYSSTDIIHLSIMCWRYHSFLLQKSVVIEKPSISAQRG